LTDQTQKYRKRLYKPSDMAEQIGEMIAHLKDVRVQDDERINKEFIERIMMAVTEVNGCRYCSYFHTQVALKEGIDRSEIQNILSGCFDDAPESEISALYFAQHFADSGGQPQADAVECLEKEYGIVKAKQIQQYIRMIMIGNTWGNAFDAFRVRLKGQPDAASTLINELGVIFGPFWMVPFSMLKMFFIGTTITSEA